MAGAGWWVWTPYTDLAGNSRVSQHLQELCGLGTEPGEQGQGCGSQKPGGTPDRSSTVPPDPQTSPEERTPEPRTLGGSLTRAGWIELNGTKLN